MLIQVSFMIAFKRERLDSIFFLSVSKLFFQQKPTSISPHNTLIKILLNKLSK